jgi:four helix bundle protein
MKDQIISRMKRLALESIDLVQSLPRSDAAITLGRQLIRSATSIGANYRSACRAKSRADFIAKVAIAEEESDETQYWLELLHDSGMIGKEKFDKLFGEANELTAILASSGKTAKENLRSHQQFRHSKQIEPKP